MAGGLETLITRSNLAAPRGGRAMQNISNSDELTIENLDDSAFGITDVDGWCFILIDNTAR
jgi:hypothetical protein